MHHPFPNMLSHHTDNASPLEAVIVFSFIFSMLVSPRPNSQLKKGNQNGQQRVASFVIRGAV